MDKINVKKTLLGEGLCTNHIDGLFGWVDIHQKRIFLSNSNLKNTHEFEYPYIPSNIFYVDKKKAILLDNFGIAEFHWKNEKIYRIFRFKENFLSSGFRTNDGVMLSANCFLFGTMHQISPKEFPGNVWLLQNNEIINIQKNHIPNSFIIIDDFILISDSFEKKIYKYSIYEKKIKDLWFDYSKYSGHPDGGFFSKSLFCYIAIWGESKILKFDKDGNIISELLLPIKFPSNCKELDNKIIITSAQDKNQLADDDSNLNGSLYSVDLF